MNSKQYTIRSVPNKVDLLLRKRARKTGQSLNKVSLEALAKGVGLSSDDDSGYDDLEWFIGSKSPSDTSTEKSLEWLDKIPNNLDNIA